MIICQRHKFIFLKTKKTAGSSVQRSLTQYCEPGCLSILSGNTFALPDASGRRFAKLGPHAKAHQIMLTYGNALADFTMISCERNPFDKLVSAYFYKGKKQAQPDPPHDPAADLEMLLRAGAFDGIMTNSTYYVGGFPMADIILRYEHLDADYANLLAVLGLPQTGLVDLKMKSNTRPDAYRGAESVARLFSPALQDFVRNRYPFYFEELGYRGPGSDCPPFTPVPERQWLRERLMRRAAAFPMHIPLPANPN